jgi:hypothetical protein
MKINSVIKTCVAILLMAFPVISQETASTSESTASSNAVTEDRMVTPPTVSGDSYTTEFLSESRSNYLRGGIVFTTAYSDNVLGGTSGAPVSDESYSIFPTISLNKTTSRVQSNFTYSPGFTFYQHTSSRNQADQNVSLDLKYRLSPHVTLTIDDVFRRTSNVFNQPNPASNTQVSGTPQSPTVAIVTPIADQLSDSANIGLSYQFAANAMVGISGYFNYLHYPNPEQVPGLYDSNSGGGSAFYTYRLSKKHYIGANYRYERILAYPVNATSDVEIHTAYLFYTVYLKPTLSISVSGGPQHTNAVQSPLPTLSQWSPSGTASISWQGQHSSLAANYAHLVTAGGGLTGAYESHSANVTARRQLLRTWSGGISGYYSINKTLDPNIFLVGQDGHSISGTVSVQHPLGEHLGVEFGYSYLHQSYDNIAAIAGAPDTNRGWISISYQFSRPLGR